MEKIRIYLDDIRTPKGPEWVVVRSYDQFVAKVKKVGLQNILTISLDHDLGDSAIQEYHRNVWNNYKLDYNNIIEKTGYDCAKWLVDHFIDTNEKWNALSRAEKKGSRIPFPHITTHSANPIGSANIMGYINNFFKNEAQLENCVRVQIPHTTI
jgi:hypothetical protein